MYITSSDFAHDFAACHMQTMIRKTYHIQRIFVLMRKDVTAISAISEKNNGFIATHFVA